MPWPTLEQKIDLIFNEFDLLRIRDRRNQDFVLRVILRRLDAQDAKLDAILAAVGGSTKPLKADLQFGKPQPKPEPPAAAAKPKEKTRG